MNKLKRSLYIVSLFKEKGSLGRQDIVDYVSNRFPGEPLLSDSTLSRYLRFIEETFSCIIEYNRSTQTYSMRIPNKTPTSVTDSIDLALETFDKDDGSNEESLTFDPRKMMFAAIRNRTGKLVKSPFLANSIEEALQKACTFYKDTLESVWIYKRMDMDKVPLSETRIIWFKGMSGDVIKNKRYNYGVFQKELFDIQQIFINELVDGTLDPRSDFEFLLSGHESEDFVAFCNDCTNHDLIYKIFKLGMVANFPYRRDWETVNMLLRNDQRVLSELFYKAMYKLGNFDAEILILFMHEQLYVYMAFVLGMNYASCLEVILCTFVNTK